MKPSEDSEWVDEDDTRRPDAVSPKQRKRKRLLTRVESPLPTLIEPFDEPIHKYELRRWWGPIMSPGPRWVEKKNDETTKEATAGTAAGKVQERGQRGKRIKQKKNDAMRARLEKAVEMMAKAVEILVEVREGLGGEL
jgi:hypothetical protein